ncbi:hypothetical protein JOF56_005241 [Kibdelosporangium banguiense]|uniref:Restriction endonuclease type IV Mrr domain-containing protein n=1 Tax=Kibdelosporangium banguiense TaxID=1365924 RepID=A0ABS4TKA9_9PSEU|nr:restriction endonuclease [Kibdelosporangium banguiense]MBP2324856.1 hypothetical protein [Kibdelosporangium banguiense]
MNVGSAAGGGRFAMVSTIAGGAAVVSLGAFLTGYLQAMALELGSAVLLLAPLLMIERLLGVRIGQGVQDGVAEALNGTASSPDSDDAQQVRDSLLRRLSGDWNLVRAMKGPFDFVAEGHGERVAIAVRHTSFPLDSATVSRLHTEARRREIPKLVVVTLTEPTDLARVLARRTPGLRLVTDLDLGSDKDISAALGLAGR